MSKRIDRRTFVRSALTAGAGVLLAPSAAWSVAQKARLATEGAFAQGVASGEPAASAITLWTRLDGVSASTNIGYEVARDAGFAKVVASGTAAVDAAADFTVHKRVSGAFLEPGEQYYYRFRTAADSSPVGRFRTARPAGSSETVRIAFFSCQEFIAGYYAAHRDLAAQDVDLVVCLGDYIYEQAFASTGLSASRARWKVIANQVMICSLDAPPHNPLNTDSWDGYGADRAELVDHIAADAIDDVTFVTGDIHTFFAGDVTRTGRQTVRGEDRIDPVNGRSRATEFVGGAITSPGIVDRAASTETERVAAAAPADAAVLANNPHLAYANQAYKGYCILEAGLGQLDVRYQAVHEQRDPDSGVFTLRRFRVDSGQPVVIDQGGPLPA